MYPLLGDPGGQEDAPAIGDGERRVAGTEWLADVHADEWQRVHGGSAFSGDGPGAVDPLFRRHDSYREGSRQGQPVATGRRGAMGDAAAGIRFPDRSRRMRRGCA